MKSGTLIFWSVRLAGSCAGAILGFCLPIPLISAFIEIGYEKALPWLLLSATIGLFAGGFGLGRLLKLQRKR
jgi:hypothetical protein